MTNKENKFPIPRATRNTVKQSMLISGQPTFLYRKKEVKETFIVFDKKKKSLGAISDDIHLALCDLAKGADIKIIREIKSVIKPVSSVDGFPSLSIQKHKKDTMIVIPAANEATLMIKVSKLKELLESKGAITQERCNWICIVDKGKSQITDDELLQKESIIKVPEMSEKTKSLRNIAMKSVKEQEKRP